MIAKANEFFNKYLRKIGDTVQRFLGEEQSAALLARRRFRIIPSASEGHFYEEKSVTKREEQKKINEVQEFFMGSQTIGGVFKLAVLVQLASYGARVGRSWISFTGKEKRGSPIRMWNPQEFTKAFPFGCRSNVSLVFT